MLPIRIVLALSLLVLVACENKATISSETSELLSPNSSLNPEQQPETSDSLSKAHLLLNKAQKLSFSLKIDSSLFYADQALKEARAESNKNLIVRSLSLLAGIYLDSGDLDKSLSYRTQMRDFASTMFGNQSSEYASSLGYFAHYYGVIGEYDKAYKSLVKQIDILEGLPNKNPSELILPYSNLGYYYSWSGKHDQALIIYKKAESLFLDLDHNRYDSWLAQIFTDKGDIALLNRDFELAQLSYSNAISLLENHLERSNPKVGNTILKLGQLFEQNSQFKSADSLYQDVLDSYIETYGASNFNLGGPLLRLGILKGKIGDHSSALNLLHQNKNLIESTFGIGHADLLEVHRAFSAQYAAQNNFNKAEEHLLKSLDFSINTFGNNHVKTILTLNALGDLHASFGHPPNALRYYNRSLQAGLFSENGSEIAIRDTLLFDNAIALNELIDALHHTSILLSDTEDYKKAFRANQNAVLLIDYLRRAHLTEQAKFDLAAQRVEVLEHGINIVQQLVGKTGGVHHLDHGLVIAEQGKANALLDAITDADARRFAGIPDSLLDQERTLRVERSFYKRLILDEENGDGDQEKLTLWKSKLFRFDQQHRDLVQLLEDDYPAYYQMKYTTVPVDLDAVRNEVIKEDDALIEFFMGRDSLYTFILTDDGTHLRTQAVNDSLGDSITEFTETIRDRHHERYTEMAYAFYEDLILPIEDLIAGKDLIIIPDGVLNALSFESLLTAPVVFTDREQIPKLPYFIRNHTVRYAFSIKTLSEQYRRDDANEPVNDFFAYAPVYKRGFELSHATRQLVEAAPVGSLRRKDVPIDGPVAEKDDDDDMPLSWTFSLPQTKVEVESIHKLFKKSYSLKDRFFGERSVIYLGEEADEQTLKNADLNSYRYLHFATHGLLNSEAPDLSGLMVWEDGEQEQDGVIHLSEIYNLELNADLVVLSACETALGQVVDGEGIISLTRGFAFSGAENIVVSQWPVDDESTAKLMLDFYTRMLEGQEIAEALRGAKLAMINTDWQTGWPYFWSPFILVDG